MGDRYWEPAMAYSGEGRILTSASARQQVQTGGEGGCPHPGQRGHWQPGKWVLPGLGSLGPARSAVAVGKTCWVSSRVFPCQARSDSQGRRVERGEGAL